jgi:hypothetical protein
MMQFFSTGNRVFVLQERKVGGRAVLRVLWHHPWQNDVLINCGGWSIYSP